MQAMLAFANRMPAVATLLVHPNNHPYDSDLLQIDSRGRVTALLPKPHPDGLIYHNLVNAAVYVFNKKILSYIAADTAQDFGKDIFPRLLQAGETLRAYHSAEYVKDMGTKDRLPVICADVESGKVSRLNKKNARPAVFLDRDGVLNRDMDKAPRAENFELLPGVSEAVRLLNQSDYLSIVVTNQPMIAKGFVTFHDVDEVHKRLETELGNEKAYLDGIYFCPHHPEKGFPGEVAELKIDCGCRKPKPGMLLRAREDFNIDLQSSWMIGDRDSDMQAGKNAGCHTILVGDTISGSTAADYRFPNLLEAVRFILTRKENND